MPIDPPSAGTWIAINDDAVAVALLNVTGAPNVPAAPREPPRSRGEIIPALMNCNATTAAVDLAMKLDPQRYNPFRLIVVDDRELAEVCSDARSLRAQRWPLSAGPFLFTTSGLGDALVQGPRTELFEQCVVGASPQGTLVQQERFHRHRWADRPHLSVCMRRGDAQTVSFTVAERRGDSIVMTYWPDAPDQPATPSQVELPIRTVTCV